VREAGCGVVDWRGDGAGEVLEKGEDGRVWGAESKDAPRVGDLEGHWKKNSLCWTRRGSVLRGVRALWRVREFGDRAAIKGTSSFSPSDQLTKSRNYGYYMAVRKYRKSVGNIQRLGLNSHHS